MIENYINKLKLGLSRKYLLGVVSGLIATGVAFLALFIVMYQSQMLAERARSSHEMAQLLLTSLRQPLIQQDAKGMRVLIQQLAAQHGITNVMLSNKSGMIRFSSSPALLKTNPLVERHEGCITCHDQPPDQRKTYAFLRDELGREVLRSVTPVPNGKDCEACHGNVALNRYTGMLVVDYDADLLRNETLTTTFLLMSAGLVLVLITLFGGWWFMQHLVLAPVSRLSQASEQVALGRLSTRVDIAGHDELAQLGSTFNDMAENLEHAVAAIKAREAFQQALIDAIPDGIRVIDSQYRLVAANAAYCAQLEIEPNDVLKAPCYQSSHCRNEPCIATLVTCPIRELRGSRQAIKFIDRHCRQDQSELEVEVYAAPLYFGPGDDEFFVVESVRNLSDNVQYSHEQKLSDLGQLAAGVAHEIRNPLTTLQMAFAQFRNDNIDTADRQEYLELATREIQRCIDVNERLLKLSTLPPSHTELVDLNACVEETVSLLNFEADQRHLQIELQLATGQLRALATDSEMRMIILNLVQNAFHALDDEGRVRVTTESDAAYLLLSVEDNGRGIASGDTERIFEPFFSRRSDGTEGTGLGLAIAKSLITRHGGNIEVDTSPWGGARFVVRLRNADHPPEETA